MNDETLADDPHSSRFAAPHAASEGAHDSPHSAGSSAASFPPTSGDLTGLTLGGYKLVRKISEGGMGQVFEALQPKLARKVAIKVLSENLLGKAEFLERFEREAKTAAALNHPNIVQIFDFGEDRGRHYLAMELVDGPDLGSYVQSRGKLDIAEALDLIEQAALGLKAACEKSIVHRDIKPANLLRTRDGVLKISDLGLAKSLDQGSELTMTGAGIGSPYYLAPEQADDARTVDHRADIYALGITLFFLLTGKRPFEGSNPFSVVLAKASKPMPTGEALGTKLPPEVEKFIRGMTATDPADRYPDYDALLADLRQVKQKRLPKFGEWPASKPSSAKTLAIAALVFFIGILCFLWTKPLWRQKTPEIPSLGPDRVAEFDRDQRPPPRDRPGLPGSGRPPRERHRFPLPRPPRPNPSPLEEGPASKMLAEADAFAIANPTTPRSVLDRYLQVLRSARSTESEAAVVKEIEIWRERLWTEAQKAINLLRDKARRLIEMNKVQEAFEVWREFPADLRTVEVDDEIERVIEAEFPRDFEPRINPNQRP